MADQRLHLKNNAGGLSDDDTYGPHNSFSEGEGINARLSPAYITLQRALQKESGSVVTTEITDAVRVESNNGDVFLAGRTKIYKRSPGSNGAAGSYEVHSQDSKLVDVQDLDYRPDVDTLMLIDTQMIHELAQIRGGEPVYSYEKYREIPAGSTINSANAVSFTAEADTDLITATAHGLSAGTIIRLSGGTLPTGLDNATLYYVVSPTTDTFQLALTSGGDAIDFTSDGAGTMTYLVGAYALPSAFVEDQYLPFELEKEPMYSITVTVAVKGTGSWTMVLHDGSDHEITSVELTNDQLPPAGSDVKFVFGEQIRGKIGATYHVHFYSSNGTGAIRSNSSSTLQAADISLEAYRLVDTGGFGHATIQLGARSYICNEKYIAEWEMLDLTDNAFAGYDPHKLIAPSEVIYLCADIYNQYTAFGGGLKRGTDADNDNPTEGVISFWNGVDDFFEFHLPVPQGPVETLKCIGNIVHFIARGTW